MERSQCERLHQNLIGAEQRETVQVVQIEMTECFDRSATKISTGGEGCLPQRLQDRAFRLRKLFENAAYSCDWRTSSGSSPRPTVTTSGDALLGRWNIGLLRSASAESGRSLSFK